MTRNRNDFLREESGEVNIDDKLVSFLYELMRDHITPGIVEEIVRNSEISGDIQYTNGWLAKYAECLAKRLK